jgi:hypothetical protein
VQRPSLPSDTYDVPHEDSVAIIDAFAWVRGYVRTLQDCSTTGEVLNLIEKTISAAFPEVSYVTTIVRQPTGRWSFYSPGIGTRTGLRVFRHNQAILSSLMEADSTLHDRLTRFPKSSLPGDILTYEDYDTDLLSGMLKRAHAEIEQMHESVMTAVMRSRSGFVAHLFLSDFRRAYDGETDKACIATLGDFASLALSS